MRVAERRGQQRGVNDRRDVSAHPFGVLQRCTALPAAQPEAMRIGVAGQNAMQAVEQQGWSVLAVVFVTRPGRQARDQIDVEALPRAITGPHDGAQLPGTVGVDLDEIALELRACREELAGAVVGALQGHQLGGGRLIGPGDDIHQVEETRRRPHGDAGALGESHRFADHGVSLKSCRWLSAAPGLAPAQRLCLVGSTSL